MKGSRLRVLSSFALGFPFRLCAGFGFEIQIRDLAIDSSLGLTGELV